MSQNLKSDYAFNNHNNNQKIIGTLNFPYANFDLPISIATQDQPHTFVCRDHAFPTTVSSTAHISYSKAVKVYSFPGLLYEREGERERKREREIPSE